MTELHDETRRLLDAERLRDELPEAGIDDAWNAFAAKLPAPIAGGTPALDTTAGGARLVKLGAALLVTFGVGVLTGRLLPREKPEEPRVVVPSPLAASAPPPVIPARVEAASVSVAPSAAIAAPPSFAPRITPSSTPSATSSRSIDDVLSDERALVEGARTAFLRGRPSDALELARRHEARFPDGELAEDRDFLITSALHDLGRGDEARRQAQAFLARYPKSGLRRSVAKMAE